MIYFTLNAWKWLHHYMLYIPSWHKTKSIGTRSTDWAQSGF